MRKYKIKTLVWDLINIPFILGIVAVIELAEFANPGWKCGLGKGPNPRPYWGHMACNIFGHREPKLKWNPDNFDKNQIKTCLDRGLVRLLFDWNNIEKCPRCKGDLRYE